MTTIVHVAQGILIIGGGALVVLIAAELFCVAFRGDDDGRWWK